MTGRGAGRRSRPGPLPIEDVREAAARAGLRAGDCIVRLNGVAPIDVLDLEMAAADGTFALTVVREGHPLELVVVPRRGEWHGISLGHGGIGTPTAVCRNRCRFCFVDQVPHGLREALYVKDDDYRLSFLHGNFITLTNLEEADFERIEELRLEPLYVSLHAWDDETRVRLMGEAARSSRQSLERLAAAGLELHLQVVLCPGWNDAEVLAETVARTSALAAVADVGIVPVSLALEGDLRRVTPTDAVAVCDAVTEWQALHRRSRGAHFVHAADEFHLLRGELPPTSDAPCQYENGIGIAAVLLAEAEEVGAGPRGPASLRALCGTLAVPLIERAAELLCEGAPLRPFAVTNRLFGEHVTVTGLLGGAEVVEALHAAPLAEGEWLLAPRAFLPTESGRTLDGVGEDELADACGGRLVLAASLTEAFARMR